jgi:hypothetical protein
MIAYRPDRRRLRAHEDGNGAARVIGSMNEIEPTRSRCDGRL